MSDIASAPTVAPLSIGLLTHSTNPRGGVVHTIELAHALHDAGHRVTVMAPAAAGQRFFRPLRCRAELIPVATAPRDMVRMVRGRIDSIARHLDCLLSKRNFDVLHTHDPIGGNALAALRDAGRIDGFVRTVHHLEHFAQPELMEWQAHGFRAASQVFTVSRMWREKLAREHGVTALEVMNGIDASRFSDIGHWGDEALAARLGVHAGAPLVLAVGGVEERKNTLRLLQAFVLLRQRHPEAQLVIAGGASLLDHAPYQSAFRACAQDHGLAVGPGEAVVLTGPLPDPDMPRIYRLADVVAMPSLNEGFGLVVLEALASGVPVVVSRIAPFTEYLHDTDCSWADPFDADSIAHALGAAIAGRSPERIASSAARLGAQFSWPVSAARHALLYRRWIDGGSTVDRATRSRRRATPRLAMPRWLEGPPCP